ncbi:MAG: hypothetical protein F4160_15050 [Rhodospirillaceae bacterium]|nr:hypothetical protein [Rhodospirillaceae bacterium]MYH38104.1 hypothetical protein [Rhodospirillaceae bacterium]MYK15394.1 hypothetical protein [Rhodospirillaceae bacterium]
MNSDCVDLIATDPPFNKSKDFHATPECGSEKVGFHDRWSWETEVQPAWLDKIQDDWPAVWEVIDAANAIYMHKTKKNLKRPRHEVGFGMGAFLCFMAVRLMEMHRILKPTGSIYLHCDHTASHYLKAVMDAIFGPRKENYRNEIIWCYRGGGVPKSDFAKTHDTILRYSKTDAVTFNVDPVRIPYSEESAERLEYKAKAFRGDKTYDAYEPHPDGKHPEDWWPIQPLSSSDPERYGYPTQKPLRLYERIILASSNPGDMVLDPFCGCATTPVCAEKHGRQWAGIDIWENARTAVVDRLVANGLLRPGDAGDRRGGDLFAEGQLHHVTVPPARTDHGKAAAAAFRTKVVIPEPPGTRMTRAEMYAHLLTQHGAKCQGCDRTFDDPRYLELDHNTPRADGGVKHISNRVLLCGPCNQLKSNIYTLSGLRRENTKRGYMAA